MDFSSFNIKDLFNKAIGSEALQPDYIPLPKPVDLVGKGKVITPEAITPAIEIAIIARPSKKRKSLASTNKMGPFETVEVVDDDEGTA